MEKIITLREASDLDDIRCLDGELLDAGFIFGSNENKDESPGAPVSGLKMDFIASLQLPAGARFVAVHVPEPGVKNFIISQNDGSLAWFDGISHPLGISNAVKVLGVADWLAVLTVDSLCYARWNGSNYDIYGNAPAPPSARLRSVAKALPPFCMADGDFPRLDIRVGVGDSDSAEVINWLAGSSNNCRAAVKEEITAAVSLALKSFVDAVANAGMYFGPVEAICAWRLSDGTLWRRTASEKLHSPIGGDESVSLEIRSADCSDGSLFMSLALSRVPYVVSSEATLPPSPWGNIIPNAAKLVKERVLDFNPESVSAPVWLSSTSRGFTTGAVPTDQSYVIFDVAEAIEDGGLPVGIFSIGGRLLAIRENGDGRENMILSSLPGLPMILAGAGKTAGNGTLHLTQSLRSLSSGQFGEFPLYAFCRDGIRALTPDAGSFRDVQLISRDVALSSDSFAPLPDATCFISKAGVMKIEGTSVSCLSKGLERTWNAADRLLYLYRENVLVVFRPGVDTALVYTFNDGRWHETECGITEGHYAWPDTLVQWGRRIGEPTLSESEDIPAAAASEDAELVPIVTRPVKLTNAFDLKQLTEVESVWPDGSRHEVRVYGALLPGKWHLLGRAPAGHMIMMGSGWRFFRFETVAIKSCGTFWLPQLRCKFR